MVIIMLYYELWNVLWNWRREFTTKEFSTVFVSPDSNKILHDMTKKGMLDRVEWGKYKVNSPEEYMKRKANITEAYIVLKEGEMDYSLTGPDAVFFWTKGGYQVDRFFGFFPIHLKVKKNELNKWESFLRSRKQKVHIEGELVKETLFGIFFVLFPRISFNTEKIDGFQVDPLNETVEFCQEKIYSYEPALEMLDEMYELGLKVKYKEIQTNF